MNSLNKILLLPVIILSVAMVGGIALSYKFDSVIHNNSSELLEISKFANELSEANQELNKAILAGVGDKKMDELFRTNMTDIEASRNRLLARFPNQEQLSVKLDSVIAGYFTKLEELEVYFNASRQDPENVLQMASDIEHEQAEIERVVFQLFNVLNENVEKDIDEYRTYLYISYTLIFISLLLVLLQIARFLLKPVKKLHRAIDGISEDRFISVESTRNDEIGDLILAFNEMSLKLYHSKQEILRANHQLAESNKELEAFAYSVSHDLRTPLRSISGFSEAVMSTSSDELSDKTKDYLNRVHQAALKMGQLIDEILKLSKIGRTILGREKVDATALVRELIDLIKTEDTEHVRFDIEDDMYLFADRGLTKVLLLNLLSNAVKFSKEEPDPHVQVGMEVRDERRYIFVKDNGVGFDMKYEQKIFGAFQRLHPDSEFEGTGIGLATVKKIVNKHNGNIFIESEVAKGTTVYFNLGKNHG